MNKDFIFASSFLANTIIGAGIFSLPFVMSAVGLWRGVVYLAFFAIAYAGLHLMYAHIVTTSEETHEFAYFAERYLGARLGKFASYLIVSELLLVLTAYLILAPSFLGLSVSPLLISLLFWFIASLFIFVELRLLEWIAAGSVFAVLGVVTLVFYASINHPAVTPTSSSPSFLLFLLPFGPLLFALNGRPGITRVVQVWRRARKSGNMFFLRNAIIFGTLLPAAIYLLFVIGVVRLTPTPSEDAISGLSRVLSPRLLKSLGVLGLLAIGNSYFMIGSSIRNVFRRDMKFPAFLSATLVVVIPPALLITGVSNFVSVVSFVGGALLAIEGILVVTMWRHAFPKSRARPFSYILYAIFIVAIIYQCILFLV